MTRREREAVCRTAGRRRAFAHWYLVQMRAGWRVIFATYDGEPFAASESGVTVRNPPTDGPACCERPLCEGCDSDRPVDEPEPFPGLQWPPRI